VILGYRDKKTEQFAEGEFIKAFQGFEDQAARRLSILNAAISLATLRALPGNRLEALKGDRAGQYSFGSTSNGVSVSSGRPARPARAMLKSWTITEVRRSAMFMRAVHPGEILKDELDELGVTPTEFARQIDVPPNRISQIIAGKRAVTGDTALRFGHWFGAEPQFWLNLQSAYELRIAEEKAGREIARLPVRAGVTRSDAPNIA
jgi:antitoxin HigA-1